MILILLWINWVINDFCNVVEGCDIFINKLKLNWVDFSFVNFDIVVN